MSPRGSRACILISGLLILSGVQGAGLSTSFVDVGVRDVPLGKARRVESKDGQSLVFWNTSDQPLVIHVQAIKPNAQELRPPAQPIEDTAWVTIQPSTLTLAPHEQGQCDVVLLLPADRKLRHRLFQAMIWSRSDPVGAHGISFTGALKSRLRFETEK